MFHNYTWQQQFAVIQKHVGNKLVSFFPVSVVSMGFGSVIMRLGDSSVLHATCSCRTESIEHWCYPLTLAPASLESSLICCSSGFVPSHRHQLQRKILFVCLSPLNQRKTKRLTHPNASLFPPIASFSVFKHHSCS